MHVEEATPLIGEPEPLWCPHCQASTLWSATIYAFTSQGSHIIGGWAVCEGCGWSPYGWQQRWVTCQT
ncbi:hypothetical protein F4561_006579 [Lipingzhangella halophila]|uniref:Uncharacterized protein n=1 Tax=Lipingzhangella halophila TaxID=1783352 RepID=A0A7W7W789_9ACTN|nr:hypothetical protein [Lipingzhangella halophila]MBB4935670.1 hypothetical protein [Lipingzhangella halophila]